MIKPTLLSLFACFLAACSNSTPEAETAETATSTSASEQSSQKTIHAQIASSFRADAGVPTTSLDIKTFSDSAVTLHNLAQGESVTMENIKRNLDNVVAENQLIPLGQSRVYAANIAEISDSIKNYAEEIKADHALYVATPQASDSSTSQESKQQIVIMFCASKQNFSKQSLSAIDQHRRDKIQQIPNRL